MFKSFSFPSSVDDQLQAGRQFVHHACDRQDPVALHAQLSSEPTQSTLSEAEREADSSMASLSQSLHRQTLGGQSRQQQSSKRPGMTRKPAIQRSSPQDYADTVRQSRQAYTQLHCRSKHLAKVASVVERLLVEGTSAYDLVSDSRRSSSDVSDCMLPNPDENYANKHMMDLSTPSGSENEGPISSYASTGSSYRPTELHYRKTSFQQERAGNVVEKQIRMRKRKVVGGQGVRHAG